MSNVTLIKTLKDVFQRQALDGLIAYIMGTAPLRPRPYIFSTPENLESAVFNGFCLQNLATYLHRHREKRMGILVKGCDRRAIRVLIQERQIERDNLYLIGIPCPGMLDRHRLLADFPELSSGQIGETGDILTVTSSGGKQTLPRSDYLLPTCRVCRHRIPEDVDLMLDPPPFGAPEADGSLADEVSSVSRMEREERAALFREELSRCILCTACRNVCPFCYCETCFTDSLQPVWMTPAPEPDNIFFYHVNRMMHMAGRCVACGSCEGACPERIPLRLLFGKITADVRELFAYEAGLDDTIPQPLSHFSDHDPDEHIE